MTLERSKYVGALVVRTFKTEAECQRAMNESAKAAKGAAKADGI